MTTIVAISGPSCSGKTTLATAIISQIKPTHTIIIHQDSYYKTDSLVPLLNGIQNWDAPEAMRMDDFRSDLKHIREDAKSHCELCKSSDIPDQKHVVVVDGILLLYDPEISRLFDVIFYVDVNYDICKSRRSNRGYATLEGYWQDPEGYFDNFVWPQHLKHNPDSVFQSLPNLIKLNGTKDPEIVRKDALDHLTKSYSHFL